MCQEYVLWIIEEIFDREKAAVSGLLELLERLISALCPGHVILGDPYGILEEVEPLGDFGRVVAKDESAQLLLVHLVALHFPIREF